ncbi:tRNA-dependent cyclodipeptide synthase [Pseudomonas sp.]|uniref:tRNA-dependent cyclodipeptide synthase n=1 Tax=Pseudomonas sp. TaxID=306 RepID=UPI00258A37A6|nr:tRNA-dependent cyclodipeptide synthase [Pseudomonas sp.]
MSSATYKAAFETELSHDYRGKHALLLISVGQDYHEGGKFEATIDLVNRQGFASCTIAVADILQRHNLSSYSYEEVYKVSAASGEQWLARNQGAINRLATVTRILRWEECLLDPGYRPLLDRVQFEYENNRDYRAEVNGTIGLFLDRLHKRDPEADLEEARFRCLNYLIEECPIIMPLWASQGIDFVVYPQPMTRAMAATRQLFVEPHHPAHGHWLSLKFKKRAAVVDQPVPAVGRPIWATAAFAI